MIALGRAAAVAVTLTLAAGVAEADSFGGIAANEKSYLVGASRVCTPIVVTAGAATGSPACHAAPADEVARLSTRLPSAERGPKAALTATAKGRVLTVTGADGAAVASWTSADTISSVVDVWQSPTETADRRRVRRPPRRSRAARRRGPRPRPRPRGSADHAAADHAADHAAADRSAAGGRSAGGPGRGPPRARPRARPR
jgi:hypothetical protein